MSISARTKQYLEVSLGDKAAAAAIINAIEEGVNIPEVDPFSLKSANNLSDLASASAARANLGLGSSDTPAFAGINGASGLSLQVGGVSVIQLVDASATSVIGSGSETDYAMLGPSDGEWQIGSNDNGRTNLSRPRWAFIKEGLQVGDSAVITGANQSIGGPINGAITVGRNIQPVAIGSPNGGDLEPNILGFFDATFHLWGLRASDNTISTWTNKSVRDIGLVWAHPGAADYVGPKTPLIVFQENADLRFVSASADLVFENDNSNSIGESTKRLKDVYIGTSIQFPKAGLTNIQFSNDYDGDTGTFTVTSIGTIKTVDFALLGNTGDGSDYLSFTIWNKMQNSGTDYEAISLYWDQADTYRLTSYAGGTGTSRAIFIQADDGVGASALFMPGAGGIQLSGNLGLNGEAPVAQSAAIADASGGSTIDTEARAALNTLLAYLRTRGDIAI